MVPDGSTIAFEGTKDLGGDWFTQVYLMDANGSRVRRLTDAGAGVAQCAEGSPAWSPDGKRLAFWSYCGGITLVERDSPPRTPDLIRGPTSGFNSHPSWSLDGAWLVFGSPFGREQLVVERADGSGLQTLTNMPGGASNPQLVTMRRATPAPAMLNARSLATRHMRRHRRGLALACSNGSEPIERGQRPATLAVRGVESGAELPRLHCRVRVPPR